MPPPPLSEPKPKPSLARAHTKAPAPANSPLPAGTGWLANLSRCLDPQRGSQTQQRRPSPSNSSVVLSERRAHRENKTSIRIAQTTTTRERSSNEGRIRAGAFPAPVPPLPPPPRPALSLVAVLDPLSSQHSPGPADAEPPAASSPRPRRPTRIRSRLVSDQTTRPDTIPRFPPIESGLQLWPPATVMARNRRRPIDSGLCPLRAQTRPSRAMAPGKMEAFGPPTSPHDRPPGPRGPTPIPLATPATSSGI